MFACVNNACGNNALQEDGHMGRRTAAAAMSHDSRQQGSPNANQQAQQVPTDIHANQGGQPHHNYGDPYADMQYFEHYPGFVADDHVDSDPYSGRDDGEGHPGHPPSPQHGRIYNWLHGKRGAGHPGGQGHGQPEAHTDNGSPGAGGAAAEHQEHHGMLYDWMHGKPGGGGSGANAPPQEQQGGERGAAHGGGEAGSGRPGSGEGGRGWGGRWFGDNARGQQGADMRRHRQQQQQQHNRDGRRIEGDLAWKMGMGDEYYNQ